MSSENLNTTESKMSDNLDEDQSNCVLCSEKDTTEMVACDGCCKWFHFSCVDVDKTIANRDWICAECISSFTTLARSNANREKELSKKLESLEIQTQRQLRYDELQRKLEELKCSIEQIANQHGVKEHPQQCSPTDEQQVHHFLARQTIPRDLPQYFGSPEQWPIFIAAYEHSTNACKFSDVENVCRLQKALKGDARKMVESLLTHPSNVPTIIETLKMLYGRPAFIIQTQIDAIKRAPVPKSDKLDSLVFYAVQVRNLIAAIDSANIKEYLNDMRLLKELVERLPPQIRLNWGLFQTQMTTEPKLEQFSNWLNTIAQSAFTLQARIPQPAKPNDNNRVNIQASQTVDPVVERTRSHRDSDIQKCQICLTKTCPNAIQCKRFSEMVLNERWNAVNRLKLCRICLLHHKSPRCQKVKECGIENCKRLHHPLLHKDGVNTSSKSVDSPGTVVASMHRNRNDILFRIVPVTLKYNNIRVDTFAFIDDGSSVTLLEDQIANLLRLKGTKRQLCMRWTDGQSHVEPDSRIGKLQIAPRKDQEHFHDITIQTISRLDLPMQSVNSNALAERYDHLRQIEFESFENAKPTLLIGLDNLHLCVPTNVKEGGRHEPVATKTRLGWDLCGIETSSSTNGHEHRVNAHLCDCTDGRLEEVVKQFYALDSIGISEKKDYQLTEEEKRAERLMKEYTVQKGSNYEVSLVWKYDQFQLPDSYTMAYKRLLCLERKLLGTPQLLEAFRNQLEHYLENGFIRKLSSSELQASYRNVWYLPVFIVENPNKPGKIRLVFDAAAKVDGVSLNTMLLRGRDLVSPLIEILIRFRIHMYVAIGDIREMFHMVHIRKEDQMAQRILWRDCQQAREPDVYAMAVMTFGATCSPYQAQYVMRLNASKYCKEYPDTVKSITDNTYVDDVLDGRETEDELLTLVKQMQFIHSQAGFEIRNFKSNSPKLKTVLNTDECNVSHSLNDNGGIEKVLGIFWCVDEDCITFSLRFNKANREVLMSSRKPTKRDILKTLMSIYDPLGLIAFVVAGLKMIQRETWRLKLSWDDFIPDDLNNQWMKWLSQLKSIETLKIPRRYLAVPWSESLDVSLHIFADAGEAGYASLVYLRVATSTNVQTSLVIAKVKAAPLKYTPIPRLELQAATVGARLFRTTIEALDITIHRSYFWSDATVVLSWLRSKKKLPIWVANRVGEIRETTEVDQWRWVPSAENVADIPTKWRDTLNFDVNSRWYKGPEFLTMDEKFWPLQTDEGEEETCRFESEDPGFQYVALQYEVQDIIDFTRFSKWNRLLRTSAYVLQFINSIRKSTTTKSTGILSSRELLEAEKFLFREAQKTYSADITLLKRGGKVPKQSKLYKLSPILDEDNIIRLKGRIENEFPIILPKSHHISKLIVIKKHEECAHQFSETVVNELRRRFHIPRLRVLVNEVRRQCQMCKIRLAQPTSPEMSPLPAGGLAINAAPFSHTGIDLFGPLFVTVHRRHEKRWVVIFTCLTIRAIHLEMVKDMSTDSFLLAFRNFVARRGQPLECYSDRGTNLIGAEKVLKEAYKEVDFDKVEEVTTSPSLKWHFNPPLSPHMGGAWERLIRSVKSAMRVIIDPQRKPSPEVLQSVLIEVESLINCRPLTYVPLDHPEQEAITPNHALLAFKNPEKPLGIPPDVQGPKLLWRQSQQALQRFYHNWTLSYRPTLTRRSKWFETTGQLKVGDIVLIIDENDKMRRYPKGRIINVTCSRDGLVRSGTVQTKDGVYVRPAVMLAKLDVDVEGDEVPSRPAV